MKNISQDLPNNQAESAMISLQAKVWDAIKMDNVDELNTLFENGADLNSLNEEQCHVIHFAAANNALRCIDYLVRDKKINVLLPCNIKKSNPIHYAVGNGHTEMLMKLVELGADINSKNNKGSAAIHIAANNGHTETLMQLVELGADINTKYKDEDTALHWAASNGHTETLIKLIELGAEINYKNINKDTTLHYASSMGRTETLAKLVELGADINAKNIDEATPLHYAAYKGHTEALAKLIELGAEINYKNINGATALHYAAYNRHTEALAKLIELGAEINYKNNDRAGETALHIAVNNGHTEMLTKLVELGADINAKNNEGSAAIHIAAKTGHTETLTKLIELGADINAKNNEGSAALHYAADNGHTEALAKLVELGADINAKNNEGVTALHMAVVKGHAEVTKYLEVATLLTNICLLKFSLDMDCNSLKQINEGEVITLAKKIMNNYLLANGFQPNYRSSLESSCSALPTKLKESLLAYFDELRAEANIQLEILEGTFRNLIEELSPMPYSKLNQNDTNNPEEKSLLEFYEKHSEYKIVGNYLKNIADSNSQLDISALNHIMLEHEIIAEFVILINKRNILPSELKDKIRSAVCTHEKYKTDIEEPTALLKESEDIPAFDHNINNQDFAHNSHEIEIAGAEASHKQEMCIVI